jgi:L-threonylcarbamoyladenylate synthase
MKTVVTRSPEEAAEYVRRGEVVAFPTETVYGLGAAIFDEAAVRKIFAAKGRPPDNPLIAHVADVASIDLVARAVPASARRLVESFFPGPLTLVLPKRPEVPAIATAGLDTIGVRMPGAPLARAFLAACGVPVVAPSANVSGRPSPTTTRAVVEDLGGRIACILAGDQTPVGIESTVVDCTEEPPVVLRAGGTPLERLREVVGSIRSIEAAGAAGLARSPGTRHRHYSPRAQVRVVGSPFDAPASPRHAFIGLDAPTSPSDFGRVRVCADADDYAHHLFEFFRECDAAGMTTIFCQLAPRSGVGVAINDRIDRASEPNGFSEG